MTSKRRNELRDAIDQAQRTQVQRAGGHRRIERDALQHDLELDANAGDNTAPLKARIAHLEQLLKVSYTRTYAARRSRDMWKARAMNR